MTPSTMRAVLPAARRWLCGSVALATTLTVTSLGARAARAQSVVVSVPSTDVTREGVAMIAHESQVNAWKYSSVYWNSFTFGTYGIGRNMELAATLYGVGRPMGNVTLAVGYKHRVPLSDTSPWEPVVAFGPMVPFSFSGQGAGIWTYGVASFRLPVLRTRFSVGPSYGTRQIFGDTTLSMLAAVEQPLGKNVALIADWFSGSHELGALVPAVQYNISHSFILIAGVKIPNSSRAGPVSGLVELTYEFEPRNLFEKNAEQGPAVRRQSSNSLSCMAAMRTSGIGRSGAPGSGPRACSR